MAYKPDYLESTMAEIGLDFDFEIESISSSSGPESDIDEGELGEYDESNAPQSCEWCCS